MAKPQDEEEAPPIELSARGAPTPREDNINMLTAKRSPAFIMVQKLLVDALRRRAEQIMLDYTAQAVAVRYQVDGFWINTAALDRPTGDAMLAVMKVISALNMNERRAAQRGKFNAEYKKKKYDCHLTSQGVPTGERAMLKLEDPKETKPQTADDLGMRESMVPQAKEMLANESGIILIASPPTHGFTITFNALLRSADRFTRNFVEIQDKAKAEKAVENVPIVPESTYDSRQNQTPQSIMERLIRTYPDVLVTRDLVNGELVNLLAAQAADKRLVIAGGRGRDCIDALLRVLQLGCDTAKFAAQVKGVLCSRLLRTLCEKCKKPYPPPPQVLMQLGIPPGKVAAFYAPHEGPLPVEDPKEEPRLCNKCQGIGFRGRAAIFELLIPDDNFRQTLAKVPPLGSTDPATLQRIQAALVAAARQCKMRTIQEEGVVLVARGVTALPELLRVLKE
ncbi:MAG: ATPase, T2SS/T4P/T4SS family [Pirellulales bacterium]